jgi:hypothetical protein
MKALLLTARTLALVGLIRAGSPFVAGLEREGTEPFAGAVLAGELGCTACHPKCRGGVTH